MSLTIQQQKAAIWRWIEQIQESMNKDQQNHEEWWGPGSGWEEASYGNAYNFQMAKDGLAVRNQKRQQRIEAHQLALAILNKESA